MWFGRGSDVVRTWFGCGSDVVRMRVGRGSDVFSDLVQTAWRQLRESGFQHSSQNSYPRKLIYFELIRRGVIYYAVIFTPRIMVLELINYAG